MHILTIICSVWLTLVAFLLNILAVYFRMLCISGLVTELPFLFIAHTIG